MREALGGRGRGAKGAYGWGKIIIDHHPTVREGEFTFPSREITRGVKAFEGCQEERCQHARVSSPCPGHQTVAGDLGPWS